MGERIYYPALHGLVDQIPMAWTVETRDAWVSAMLHVLDYSVDLIEELHDEIPERDIREDIER